MNQKEAYRTSTIELQTGSTFSRPQQFLATVSLLDMVPASNDEPNKISEHPS